MLPNEAEQPIDKYSAVKREKSQPSSEEKLKRKRNFEREDREKDNEHIRGSKKVKKEHSIVVMKNP